MGMFDSIRPEKATCPYCGTVMENPEFQTKDGECQMADYYTWEAFGETVPTLGSFTAYTSCPSCEKWIELSVRNESHAHKAIQASLDAEFNQRWEEQRKKYVERQNAEHPNHPIGSEIWMSYLVSNAYCDRCKEEGIAKGEPHPDNVFVKARLEARAKYLEEHPRSCIECGQEIFLGSHSPRINQKLGTAYPRLCDRCLIQALVQD